LAWRACEPKQMLRLGSKLISPTDRECLLKPSHGSSVSSRQFSANRLRQAL
jgi:hypothetical protein